MPPKPVRRVLGYARVSSIEQALGTSLRDQQDAITAFAKGRGLKVHRFYVEAESGTRERQERRTQMLALHADVRDGDLVLCSKLDRWSRDTEHTLRSVREILEKGASFFAIDDSCDPSTRDGYMMMTMRAMMAREEHARIKDRLVGTRMLLRNAGMYVEGLVPPGYVRSLPRGAKGPEKNVLLVEPEGAKTVRRVYAMCIAGKSLREIGDVVELKKGTVFKILRSRIYLGQVQNSAGEWIKGRHEALVDADTFQRARRALAVRNLAAKPLLAKAPGAPAETSKWILRDVARCPCGARMSASYGRQPGPNRLHYYRCPKMCGRPVVPVPDVEAAAEPLIVARLLEIRDELARAPKAEPAPQPIDTTAKRAKLAARRDRFVEQHAEGMIDTPTLRTKLAAVDDALQLLDAEEGATRRPKPLSDPKARRAALRGADALRARWARARPEIRRQIVNALAVEVRVEKGADPIAVWLDPEALSATMD